MTGVRAGLCSITFRSLDVATIIDLAVSAGLDGIEWGADVHVPVGDGRHAADVARRSADAGLSCPSYGSYVMAGQTPNADVVEVLETAMELGTTSVRIWAPFGTGPDAPAGDRAIIADGIREATDLAAQRDLAVSLEFHPGTLTGTAASTLDLLAAVDRPNLFTYWQPDPSLDDASALEELAAVHQRLSHLHVFSWGTGFHDRKPLATGTGIWERALGEAGGPSPWTRGGRDRYAFLEYVQDDDPTNLRGDAATLRAWLGVEEPADA